MTKRRTRGALHQGSPSCAAQGLAVLDSRLGGAWASERGDSGGNVATRGVCRVPGEPLACAAAPHGPCGSWPSCGEAAQAEGC